MDQRCHCVPCGLAVLSIRIGLSARPARALRPITEKVTKPSLFLAVRVHKRVRNSQHNHDLLLALMQCSSRLIKICRVGLHGQLLQTTTPLPFRRRCLLPAPVLTTNATRFSCTQNSNKPPPNTPPVIIEPAWTWSCVGRCE